MNEIQREALRAEMKQLQKDLHASLGGLLTEVGSKLSADERRQIAVEIDEINEVVERLATGRVWLALFGKASVGKSAVVNALQRAEVAEVGVQHDLTTKPAYYEHGRGADGPYMIVDVPGIMGKAEYERMAIEEAKKAHGHIFVIDGEPYQDELELFDIVARATPESPRLVLVNKADRLEQMPGRDRKIVMERIREKMSKYVQSPDDIVYGSALQYDRRRDAMVRQELTALENRLYDNVGTLGQIVNVFDPANRADKAVGGARKKIFEMRKNIARKLIQGFAVAEAGSSAIPFSDVVATPGLLYMLTRSVVKVMGEGAEMDAAKTTKDILAVCVEFMSATFIIGTAAGVALDFLGPVGWILSFLGLAALKYTRTLIYGEALLLYIENGFSFGRNAKEMIARAKESASRHYKAFRNRK